MSHTLRRGLVGLLTASALALLVAGAAGAAITPVANDPAGATAIANAMAATPGVVTGAVFTAAPPVDSPNGTADSALTEFPTNGSTFGILTTGSVANVDDPGTFTTVNLAGPNVRGNTDFDVSILRIDLNAPLGSNCLTFDFKFLSEEFPFYVGLSVQRRVHRRARHLDLDDGRQHHHRPEQLRVRRARQRRQHQLDRHRRNDAAQGAGTAYDGGGTGPAAHRLRGEGARATPFCCRLPRRSRRAPTRCTSRSSTRATGTWTRPCSSTTSSSASCRTRRSTARRARSRSSSSSTSRRRARRTRSATRTPSPPR